ncbi:putative transcription factor C2H2 family [Medicago truncatula]|uniref:Putative transcription factor C2H2 family n=1 Tax=Medicago truncatula TaxID=3880 RepID=A0A396JPT4_MEDTR|nr:protein indeterminate-domain 5, chloroplastic [Medicago truncatula]RHN78205.1 putative transcription factor C2H2 family [Medicago truncatula]
MAAASSSTPFLEIRQENQSQITQQHQSSTDASSTAAQPLVPQKKRRNQPGTPYPDAEVIALSPKTLMATNRFVCEVCQKGFQREQNLQLHRRGHNLPWKLKQKSNKEPKRKVYLCPEPTCVHHDPSRALGDLTGIKKHFSRKHGEKKWKCEKCSKKYAVQSDWKAHSKTCGTREYRCDCGTLFSRRDSFITHRAFCDALAHENARHPSNMNPLATHLFSTNHMSLGLSQISTQQGATNNNILSLGNIPCTPKYEHHLISPLHQSSSSSFGQQQQQQSMSSSPFFITDPNQTFQQDLHQGQFSNKQLHLHHGLMQLPDLQGNTNNNTTSSSVSPFNLSFFPNTNGNNTMHDQFNNISESHHHQHHEGFSSLFGNSSMQQQENMLSSPHMSATALLQKAAQIGSTTTTINNNNGVESDEQHQHLHGLMNSLGNGNTSIYDNNNLGQFHNVEDENKKMSSSQQSLVGNLCFGGSDKLTLDFLGVGGMVRNMNTTSGGGFSQREQQLHSMSAMNNMDPKLESTQGNQPF